MVIGTNPETNENPLSRWLKNGLVLNPEIIAYLVIFALAVFTRFYMLGDRVMSHDESLHTRFSYNLYKDGDFQHTPLMHGPVLFHAAAFSYYLFGDGDFTARIYTSLLGVLLVMSPLLFRRWLGKWGALLACIMLLISPITMYYNRYIREDTPNLFYTMLMMWAMLMYVNGSENQRRRAHWLYLLAGAMLMSLASKETAFMYIFIFGTFLALYWFVRLIQHFFDVPGKPLFHLTTIGILLGGVLAIAMYIILDIIKFDLFSGPDDVAFSGLALGEQQIFFGWTLLAILIVIATTFITLLSAYTEKPTDENSNLLFGILRLIIRLVGMIAVVIAALSPLDVLPRTIILIAIVAVANALIYFTLRQRIRGLPWAELAYVIGMTLLVGFILVVVEERSHTEPLSSGQAVVPAVPGEEGDVAAITSTISWLPMIAVWVGMVVVLVFLFVVRRRPADDDMVGKDKMGRGFWGTMDLFPEFDVMIIIGTLILPWATAIIPYVMKGTSTDFINIANALPPVAYNVLDNLPNMNTPDQIGQLILGGMALLPLLIISVAIGLAWNWRRWLIASTIFHALWAFFFTTVFTNMPGLMTGMVYSLGYWLEQQGVRRGSQPQYYYLVVVMPFYEFLPVLGSILATFTGLTIFWKRRKEDNETRLALRDAMQDVETSALAGDEHITDEDQERHYAAMERMVALRHTRQIHEIPFLFLWAWLGVFNLILYSLAGEKMPWLAIHLTFPLIFLTAWFFGRIFDKVNWQHMRQYGWILLLILPVLTIVLLQVFGSLVIGRGPFQGLTTAQLQQTYGWLASAAVGMSLIGGVIWLVRRFDAWLTLRHAVAITLFSLLGLITFRSAWMASFINYDYPNEFLVYAHAAPAIKDVLEEIEKLSFRITDGKDLKFAYDNSVSWPYSWYFRDYPNAVFIGENPTVQNLEDAIVVVVGDDKRGKVEPILEDRYQLFEHMRLWWPMQDYFNLNTARVINTLDFSSANTNAAQIREGIFNIWWSRDYSLYGTATQKDFSLTNWPVSDRMLVYIRKDVARLIYPYGTGEGVVFEEEPQAINICRTNWIQDKEAIAILESDQLINRPLGLAQDSEGNLYIAEEFGHKLSVFDAEGNYVNAIGIQGDQPGTFNRPNSVAVAADGSLFVADTWNFRIQHINSDGTPLTLWGQPGEFGFGAPSEPQDGFWGPRDVKLDSQGRIYVADTGNKRIRVYQLNDNTAEWVYDLGRGGSGDGELDEPSAIAIHPLDGRVFIVDTWNRRVSVFNSDGNFLTSFPVRAWYEEKGNRPYIAIDAQRDLVYVTDPDGGRVLVYNTAGECQGSFGSLAGEVPTNSGFSVVGGILVDKEGFVYVTDASFGRILKFEPFTEILPPAENANAGAGEVTLEITEEVTEDSEAAE